VASCLALVIIYIDLIYNLIVHDERKNTCNIILCIIIPSKYIDCCVACCFKSTIVNYSFKKVLSRCRLSGRGTLIVRTKQDTLRSFRVTPTLLDASLNSTTCKIWPRRKNKINLLEYWHCNQFPPVFCRKLVPNSICHHYSITNYSLGHQGPQTVF